MTFPESTRTPEEGKVDHAQHRHAVVEQPDHRAAQRRAGGVVDRAVERVDDPDAARVQVRAAALLAVEADLGRRGRQRALDRRLAGEVDLGQEVLGRLADPGQGLFAPGPQHGHRVVHRGMRGLQFAFHAFSLNACGCTPSRSAPPLVRERQIDGSAAPRRLRTLLTRTPWTEIPVRAWLIEHPDGPILVDTGQTARFNEPGYLPPENLHVRRNLRWRVTRGAGGRRAAARARPRGRRPPLHGAHAPAPGPRRRPRARQGHRDRRHRRPSTGRARGLAGRLRGYLPHRWPEGFAPRTITLPDEPYGPFPRSLELARGDRAGRHARAHARPHVGRGRGLAAAAAAPATPPTASGRSRAASRTASRRARARRRRRCSASAPSWPSATRSSCRRTTPRRRPG